MNSLLYDIRPCEGWDLNYLDELRQGNVNDAGSALLSLYSMGLDVELLAETCEVVV